MKSLSYLEKWVAEKGLPKFRAKQIYQAITKNLIGSWDESIELPKEWHQILNREVKISELEIKEIIPSSGQINQNPTTKIAFLTQDELIIESVLMRHSGDRNTVCVSTQIGCAMNCAFCATGKMGFSRNLEAGEIVDQVLEFARLLNPEKVTNVVFMGMGEPFLNYDNVIEAIRILNDKDGFNLGIRHMTISTSGIVPGILRFADEQIQVNLAVSLHAPNNEIRDSIMPVNHQYPLEELLPAINEYMGKTGRKVFFEYILLEGINDSKENMDELIDLMREHFGDRMQLVHINLIEYNPVRAENFLPLQFKSPNHKTTKDIFDYLQKNKILTTVRYRFGDDIGAACGQLAGK
jgi:23S rRNA (adenine2503-C2)-methyltransferase